MPPATRRALNLRDQHCCWPGCDRPPSYTEAHHLVPWTRGGRTDLPNLVLLCYRHHWQVHEGGWTILRSDQGWVTIPPVNRVYAPVRGPDVVQRK